MYLNVHTYFSLQAGTLSVAELVSMAQERGIETMALTDIHSTAACYDFVKACRAVGIDPVIGMEFRRGDELLYIALARNMNGFQAINQFYSQFAMQGKPFPDLPPYLADTYLVYPWARRDVVSLSEREYLGIKPPQTRQLLRSRYRHRQDKLVVLQPVFFNGRLGHEAHRILRSIHHNTLLSKLKASEHVSHEASFIRPDELRKAFADFPQILRNTDQLLADCSFNFVFGQRLTKQTFTGAKYDDMLLLEKLAREGLQRRYGAQRRDACKRLERELEIIDQLDFNAYFLITWDFIQYGRSCGFFHVGRGSGANSLVAYCLGISEVDPLELNLYFERFLNPKRTSPPDFDIDYSWKDRDAVLAYALRRYRGNHAALLATHHTFKGRSAIREVGKVFGLPKREIDILAHLGLDGVAADEVSRRVLMYAKLITGFPHHLSVHAGGVLIAEEPIHRYTATDLPPKGFPITHFDMYMAEEIGLHKFDILSQRGLGHIRDAVEIVQATAGETIKIHEVETFKRDPKIKELLRKGQTVGCFYVESPAMRGLLRKLACDDYLTLVAASSVIRPGVARSGMMRSFIARHNGEAFTYAHPKLGELLADTYGIMVYQEDVLKVVHGFAGLDLADADLLRRAMTGKSKTQREFEEVKARFLNACQEKGYPDEEVQEIWRQIESFAGYSFSKAHSASFAVESFQSLYLKAHYPLAFMVAVINNFGGFYQTEFYLHEARLWGATVEAPCVNTSTYHTCLVDTTIYLGFIHLKELESVLGQQIAQERGLRGPFRNLEDFRHRLMVSESQLMVLIRIGAFRFTGRSKAQLLWEAKMKPAHGKATHQVETLFTLESTEFEVPDLPDVPLEDAYDEIELLGFPLCSPFSLVPHLPENQFRTTQFRKHLGKVVCIAGYFICAKTTKTINGERMQFANFIDQDGAFFDVTIFPPEVKQYPIAGPGIYMLTGMVVEEFGVYSLELMTLKKYVYQPDPRLVGGGE